MSTFNYRPLSHSDNFRLLKVSVKGDSNIVCKLDEFLLPTDHLPKEPPPKYAALSYTWGDPADTVPITCDGAELQVTTNLAEALRKVMKRNPNEYLWVDQICINQQDYEEKSKQVQRMTKIYDLAITVLTWLGPERDDTGLAVDWIRKVSSLTKGFGNDVFRDYENSEERDKIETFEKLTHEQSAELGVPFTNMQAWNAFAAFYESPWFRRIWIVQELLPAREALVIRGNHSVDWHMVKAAAAWYVYKAFYVREELDLKYPLHGPFSAIRMNLAWNSKSGSEFHPEMFGQKVRPVVRGNFDGLLRTFHDFEASEERDKMYALFGISAWHYLNGTQELLRIDYSKPVMHVYRDAIKAHLKQNSGYQDCLNILWNGTYPSKEPDWPSWVLDLRVKLENTGHGAPMPQLDLNGFTNSHIWRCNEDSFDDNTLLVEGMTFGSIINHSEYQCSGDLYTNLRAQWNKFEQLYTEQFKTDKYKASGDICENIRTAFFMALTAGKLWSGFKNKGTSPELYAANVIDMMETFCLPHETYEEHQARMEKLQPFFELGRIEG